MRSENKVLQNRPRLLDLFCGAGGAAMGYYLAGFEVVGVDIDPQPNYPFEFRQMSWDYAIDDYSEFDAIHASPPCQSWTAYKRRPNHVGPYPDLIAAVRDALHEFNVPYVIENLPRAPLLDPVILCGSSFGLDVRRHRAFEASFPLIGSACAHDWQTPRFAQATNRQNKRSTVEVGVWRIPLAEQQRAMGIDWMTLEELSEAVPPAYTEFIGAQVMHRLEAAA